MGDRCFLSITAPRKTLEAFEKIVPGTPEDTNDENTRYYTEVNWAAYDEIGKLADEGHSFYGYNTAGDNYGDCVWACYEGELVECDALQDSTPAIAVRNGEIDEHALKRVRTYETYVALVLKIIEGGKEEHHAD